MTSRVSGETTEIRRAAPRRRRDVPLADDPGDDTAAVRRRRRRPRRRGQRARPAWPTTPASYVIVGSGKTATDGIVWLLANGVPPDRIVWIRPRDPWMLNRAVVQPDPVVALGLAADTMAAAADAASLDELFLRLEASGVMLRIDTTVTPTMAKTPTLGTWELDQLRTIEHVVRLGHVDHVTRARDRPRPAGRSDSRRTRSSCTARPPGCAYPPLVPIWAPDAIRLQTIRVGFPCFCAALAGYVEATRDDDRERNRAVPAQRAPRRPDELGADAGTGDRRGARRTAPSRTSRRGPTAAR